MPFISSFDNSRIYYETKGEGDITLLFANGVGSFIEYWQFQSSLSDKFQLVLFDYPGYHKSISERDEHTIRSYAKDITTIIQKLNLSDVILVGWSMGGPVTLEAAILNPNTIIGIIGVDTFFPFNGSGYIKMTEEQIKNHRTVKLFKEAIDKHEFLTEYEKLYKLYLTTGNPISQELAKQLLEMGELVDPKIFLDAIISMFRFGVLESASQVNVPIRTIMAGNSVPRKQFRKNFNKSTNGVVDFNPIFFEGVSHAIMLQIPKQFNKTVISIVTEFSQNNS